MPPPSDSSKPSPQPVKLLLQSIQSGCCGTSKGMPPGTRNHRLRSNIRHTQHVRGCLPGSRRDAELHGGGAGGPGAERLRHRPPTGHHAEPEASMGFCLLNNIAISAQQALAKGIGKS